MAASGIEALVCKDIEDRQAVGLKKYGVSVADNPLSFEEWIEHAYQESLDFSIYLKKIKVELAKRNENQ